MKRRVIAAITTGILVLSPALTACDEEDREDVEDVGREIEKEIDEEIDDIQDNE